jgi:hypothetical protein
LRQEAKPTSLTVLGARPRRPCTRRARPSLKPPEPLRRDLRLSAQRPEPRKPTPAVPTAQRSCRPTETSRLSASRNQKRVAVSPLPSPFLSPLLVVMSTLKPLMAAVSSPPARLLLCSLPSINPAELTPLSQARSLSLSLALLVFTQHPQQRHVPAVKPMLVSCQLADVKLVTGQSASIRRSPSVRAPPSKRIAGVCTSSSTDDRTRSPARRRRARTLTDDRAVPCPSNSARQRSSLRMSENTRLKTTH